MDKPKPLYEEYCSGEEPDGSGFSFTESDVDDREFRLIAMDNSCISLPRREVELYLDSDQESLEETQTFCKTKKSLDILARFFKESVVYCPSPFELDLCLEVMYAGFRQNFGKLINMSAKHILMNLRTDADWQELYNKRYDLFQTTSDPEIFTEMLIRELNRRHPISVDFVTITGE